MGVDSYLYEGDNIAAPIRSCSINTAAYLNDLAKRHPHGDILTWLTSCSRRACCLTEHAATVTAAAEPVSHHNAPQRTITYHHASPRNTLTATAICRA